MTRFEITMEFIKSPGSNDEFQRLISYTNLKYGANGWCPGGVSTVAGSSGLLFVFFRPRPPEGMATTAFLGDEPPEAPTTEATSPTEPSPSARRRRRGGGNG